MALGLHFIRIITAPVPAPFFEEEERQSPHKILCMDLTSEPASSSAEHEPPPQVGRINQGNVGEVLSTVNGSSHRCGKARQVNAGTCPWWLSGSTEK